MRFPMFPLHLFKVLCLPRKSEAMSYEALRLSHKIILANLKIWCSKMQPLVRKSARWPPNISDEHVSCTAPAAWNSSLQIFFKCPMAANAFETATKPSRLALFWQGAEPVAPATTTVQRPKMVRHVVFFIVLLPFWLRNVLRAPAPCTLNFQQLNFQKCSEPDCFSQFWLRNVLRATTACTFSTARLQNGLQFFISHLPRWLRTRRFSQPIFRPSGARRHWKNTGSRGFSTFSHTCIFFPLTLSLLVLFLLLFSSLLFSSPLVSSLLFSSLPFPSLLFSSLLFSDSSHLCFSICAHCRKFDF